MLGPAKPRRLDQPIAVSLEDLIPQDHFYRHLEAKLDLSFVRDWTRALYGERGRPSIDPVVFFKLPLVMFFEGIRAYVPLADIGQRVGIFGDQDFRYDAEADVYHCPGNAVLRFLSQSDATHRRIYQAPAAVCKTCALRAQCTTSPRGRRVSRNLDEPYLDRVRGYHTTELYAKAMRKRQVWVEPLFAEAKAWHGLRRFRLRGLRNVNTEGLLIAAEQNLKRFLAATG